MKPSRQKLIEQIKITVSTFNGKIYQSYSHLSVRDTIFYNVAYFEIARDSFGHWPTI